MGWGQLLGTAVGTYFGGATGAGIGGAIGGAFDQDSANSYNSAEAAKNRDFQLNSSNTSYQRAMADMSKAGLNPMLAFSNGGASVPTGATASFSNVVDSSGTAVATASQAESSAKQAHTASRMADSAVMKISQEIENLTTDNERSKALIDNIRVEYQNLIKQGYNLTEAGNQIRATISKLRAEVPLINEQQFNVEINRRLSELDYSAAKKFDNFGREAQQIKPLLDLLKHIFRPSSR